MIIAVVVVVVVVMVGEDRNPASKEGKQGRGREGCHSGSIGEAANCVGVAEAHSVT